MIPEPVPLFFTKYLSKKSVEMRVLFKTKSHYLMRHHLFISQASLKTESDVLAQWCIA